MELPESLHDIALRWYHKNGRKLPWRHTKDPYPIWISEVMLQQTTVATVISRFTKWLERFPSLESLANSSLEDVLKEFSGLGYYNRARNIHLAAQILKAKGFPKTSLELQNLPGFGPYMSQSVATLCFNDQHMPIDVNTHRIATRIFGRDLTMDEAKIFWDENLFINPTLFSNELVQALMDIGSIICTKKNPLCMSCPFSSKCRAFKLGIQNEVPTPKVKAQKQSLVSIRLLVRFSESDLIFVGKRTGWLKGYFDLPEILLSHEHTSRHEIESLLMGERLFPTNIPKPISYNITHHKIQGWIAECELSFKHLKEVEKFGLVDVKPISQKKFLEELPHPPITQKLLKLIADYSNIDSITVGN